MGARRLRKRSGSALITALMLLIVTGVLCMGITVQCVEWRREYRTETTYMLARMQATVRPASHTIVPSAQQTTVNAKVKQLKNEQLSQDVAE